MDVRTVVTALVLVVAFLALGAHVLVDEPDDEPSPCVDVPRPSVESGSAPQDQVEVWLAAPNGTVLARVEARIAATPEARRIGLREVEHLPDGHGMLFVHGSEATWTYSTAGVSYPLDIVFAGSEGDVTAVHHAPAAPGGSDEFSGRGRYVLQVPRGYTNETSVDVGDCLAIPSGLRNAA